MTVYCDPSRRPWPGGPDESVRVVESLAGLAAALDADPAERLVVLGPSVPLDAALGCAESYRVGRPTLGVLLLRDRVEVDVLAAAIRAGLREVVPAGDPAALGAAAERSLRLSAQLEAGPAPGGAPRERAEAQVVTVFAGKGGCGKSTVATNLAVTLAAGGSRRVCLIDLDLQFGDVGILLQLTPDRGIADAIAMAGRLDEAGLRSLLTPYRPGVDVLLAPTRPAEGDHVTRQLVTELVTQARSLFDFIVIDTPPYFSDQVLAALDVTDRFVLVVTPDLPTLKSIRLTLDMFELLGYAADRRLVLLNRADSAVGLSVADVERAVGAPMAVLMPSSRDVPVSVNRGVPLAVEKPRHPVSRAIGELAAQCVPGGRATTHRRRGVFGRRG
ncbi:pilus assembly protein CpaE [Micromonospora pattaloongensis]|uniref:Pilus assembly protein CpaE n=1 Tax=Micromonospora pattaloongensis TaxID=405436 RepID=A0A1H3NPY1_9ACTN|nr:P-loop NTPase [Micromonospora pattaloongensis]SDY90823.1 pilus assembly protein CpaE [Micromonospora pattaloongensis]